MEAGTNPPSRTPASGRGPDQVSARAPIIFDPSLPLTPPPVPCSNSSTPLTLPARVSPVVPPVRVPPVVSPVVSHLVSPVVSTVHSVDDTGCTSHQPSVPGKRSLPPSPVVGSASALGATSGALFSSEGANVLEKKGGGAPSPISSKEVGPQKKKKRKNAFSTHRSSHLHTMVPPLSGSFIKCAHQNANGIHARVKDGSFIRFLMENDPTVLCISEFRCRTSRFFNIKIEGLTLKQRLRNMGYAYVSVHSSPSNAGYAGVAIISKLPFCCTESGLTDHIKVLKAKGEYSPRDQRLRRDKLDEEARLLRVDFPSFSLLCAYAPNSGVKGDLKSLDKHLLFGKLLMETLRQLSSPYILVGDLNVVRRLEDAEGSLLHSRYTDHPGCTDQERQLLEDLISKEDLLDLQVEEQQPGFTHKHTSKHYRLRLDYVLVQRSLTAHVRNFQHSKGMGSDHTAQLFEVDRSLFLGSPATITPQELHETTYGDWANTMTCLEALDLIDEQGAPAAAELLLTDESLSEVAELPADSRRTSRLTPALHGLVPYQDLLELDETGSGCIPIHKIYELLDKVRALSNMRESFTDPSSVEQILDSIEYIETQPGPPVLINLDISVPSSQFGNFAAAHAQQRMGGIADTGCSASTVSMRELCKLYGPAQVRKHLYTGGYLPIFNIADGSRISAVGQLKLRFRIGGVEFHHVFFVLPTLSHPFILGNNFLRQVGAEINYRNGSLVMHSSNGEASTVNFGVQEISSLAPYSSPRTETTLVSDTEFVLDPHSARFVSTRPAQKQAAVEAAGQVFGLVYPHTSNRSSCSAAHGVTVLKEHNIIQVANLSSQPLVVKRNKPLAFFREVPRSDYDIFHVDLDSMELRSPSVLPGCTCHTCLPPPDLPSEEEACVFMSTPRSDTPIPEWVAQLATETRPPEFDEFSGEDWSLPPNPDWEVAQWCAAMLSKQEPSAGEPSASYMSQEDHDKFVPFQGEDDEHMFHLPRWTLEALSSMTPAKVKAEFESSPLLKQFKGGESLCPRDLFRLQLLILRHLDTFGKSDCPGMAHHAGMRIDTGNATPRMFPLRPTMPHLRPVVDKHIDVMLKHGIIEPSQSPWGASVLLVPKKGTELRFCLDFRLVNACTVADSYPLPRAADALSSLSGNSFFSALDALAGFWNIPMADEASKQRTAFRCHRGSFQFNRMPFGLRNAPAAFQRYMDNALSGLNFRCALIYLDDILVMSPTFEQHLKDLESVFNCVRKAGLHLKLKKCDFASNEVNYLGHVVDGEGVKPCPKKVKIIREFEPTSRADIRSWIGLTSYYRRMINKYAEVVRPLQDFITSRKPFQYSKSMRKAVDKIKEALTSSPVMSHPDFSKPFEIHCDASPHAIGATLVQQTEQGEKVIMYISRALKKHERNYHQYEREALALVWSVTVFKPYVLGHRFKVVTDNKALIQLFKKDPESRIIRWVLALQQYDIEYYFRAGTKHADADGLSRAFHVKPWVCYTKGDNIESLQSFYDGPDPLESLCLASDSSPEPKPPPSHAELLLSGLDYSQEGAEDLSLPSLEELTTKQRKDPALSECFSTFESLSPQERNERRSSNMPCFFVDFQGVLRKRTKEGSSVICVPASLKRVFLFSVHGLPISGHEGIAKTYNRLRGQYYWKGMYADCEKWVRACIYCQRRKFGRPLRHGQMLSLQSDKPWDVVSFDIVGPLSETERGNEYLLTVVDHFTRYPLAIPIPDRKMSTVVEALHTHLISVFGPPRVLHSDCERSFVSAVTKSCFEKFGIRKVETTGYQPQANGCVERFHRYLNAALTMVSNAKKDDWDLHVSSALYAYRTSICASTGFSPFRMLFGRDPKMPSDLAYALDEKCVREESKRGIKVSSSVQEMYRQARVQQLKVHLANKKRVDSRRKQVKFEPGDLVMLYDHNFDTEGASKLQWLMSGPHIILDAVSGNPNLYYIQRTDSKGVHKVNVNMLRHAALHEDLDLGPPLGWQSVRLQPAVPENPSPEQLREQLTVGQMVAVRVASEELEKLPFSIGEVTQINKGEGNFIVQWYGTRLHKIGGVWKPGFEQKDGRYYYSEKRLHRAHRPYTSKTTETLLEFDDIIGRPFALHNKRIPKFILKAASEDDQVDWSLPKEELQLLYSVDTSLQLPQRSLLECECDDS